MTPAQQAGIRLQKMFRRIEAERMQGLPFLRAGLQVQAVDFIEWQQDFLGVLITPWFMNLVLLPGNIPWPQYQIGEKCLHWFPSGEYEFIAGQEDGVGCYQMCSLFSPMHAFADQDAAVATAQAVMQALLDEQNIERLNNPQYWESEQTASVPDTTNPPQPKGFSRRALFGGNLAADQGDGS